MAASIPHQKERKERWVPPLKELVKVDVDASFDEDNYKRNSGVVIRESKESFIAAKNSSIPPVFKSYRQKP